MCNPFLPSLLVIAEVVFYLLVNSLDYDLVLANEIFFFHDFINFHFDLSISTEMDAIDFYGPQMKSRHNNLDGV